MRSNSCVCFCSWCLRCLTWIHLALYIAMSKTKTSSSTNSSVLSSLTLAQRRSSTTKARLRHSVAQWNTAALKCFKATGLSWACIACWMITRIQCESKKKVFLHFFPEQFRILSPHFTCPLYVPIYARLQIFIQLPPTVTKLCHIKCDHPACVSVDGGHFEHMMVVTLHMA